MSNSSMVSPCMFAMQFDDFITYDPIKKIAMFASSDSTWAFWQAFRRDGWESNFDPARDAEIKAAQKRKDSAENAKHLLAMLNMPSLRPYSRRGGANVANRIARKGRRGQR